MVRRQAASFPCCAAAGSEEAAARGGACAGACSGGRREMDVLARHLNTGDNLTEEINKRNKTDLLKRRVGEGQTGIRVPT